MCICRCTYVLYRKQLYEFDTFCLFLPLHIHNVVTIHDSLLIVLVLIPGMTGQNLKLCTALVYTIDSLVFRPLCLVIISLSSHTTAEQPHNTVSLIRHLNQKWSCLIKLPLKAKYE